MTNKPDPKYLVEKGYDQIALRYLEWSSTPSPARMSYLEKVMKRLPAEAKVLELGCGAGVPCTQLLAERAHVTGIDISAVQIALARQHVPTATLFQADMMSLTFAAATFDAIVAFYADLGDQTGRAAHDDARMQGTTRDTRRHLATLIVGGKKRSLRHVTQGPCSQGEVHLM